MPESVKTRRQFAEGKAVHGFRTDYTDCGAANPCNPCTIRGQQSVCNLWTAIHGQPLFSERATMSKRIQTPYDDRTYRIIGGAMAIHRKLGPGLREDTYQRDLEAWLTANGLAYEAQRPLEIYDSSQGDVLIGYYIPDFIVADTIVVEIKALSGLDNSHLAQVIGYLAVTGCPMGLLINFGARSLQWRRVFPSPKITEHQINRQWLFVPDRLKKA